mmetsp:Transcript_42707/g.114330  ORF Transcript_42707/g.114330 Transcript_42707/m.114330 type:complete len:564 (-) Transcript_42707:406-2097(-)
MHTEQMFSYCPAVSACIQLCNSTSTKNSKCNHVYLANNLFTTLFGLQREAQEEESSPGSVSSKFLEGFERSESSGNEPAEIEACDMRRKAAPPESSPDEAAAEESRTSTSGKHKKDQSRGGSEKSQSSKKPSAAAAERGSLEFGDLFWLRIKGFPEWPVMYVKPENVPEKRSKAVMKTKKGDKSILVFTFGDHMFCWASPADLKPFREFFNENASQNTQNKSYILAVQEAEDEESKPGSVTGGFLQGVDRAESPEPAEIEECLRAEKRRKGTSGAAVEKAEDGEAPAPSRQQRPPARGSQKGAAAAPKATPQGDETAASSKAAAATAARSAEGDDASANKDDDKARDAADPVSKSKPAPRTTSDRSKRGRGNAAGAVEAGSEASKGSNLKDAAGEAEDAAAAAVGSSDAGAQEPADSIKTAAAAGGSKGGKGQQQKKDGKKKEEPALDKKEANNQQQDNKAGKADEASSAKSAGDAKATAGKSGEESAPSATDKPKDETPSAGEASAEPSLPKVPGKVPEKASKEKGAGHPAEEKLVTAANGEAGKVEKPDGNKPAEEQGASQ